MPLFSKKKSAEPLNIDEVLSKFKELNEKFEKLARAFEKLEQKNADNLQKIAIVRFNPFSETGSNQSFSLAVLDGSDCGAVITSLFNHDSNRVYGKPVKNGISEFALSEEEKKAIEIAQKRDKP